MFRRPIPPKVPHRGRFARNLRAISDRRAKQAAKEAAAEEKKRRAYLLAVLRRGAVAVLLLGFLVSAFILAKDYRAGKFGSVEIKPSRMARRSGWMGKSRHNSYVVAKVSQDN